MCHNNTAVFLFHNFDLNKSVKKFSRQAHHRSKLWVKSTSKTRVIKVNRYRFLVCESGNYCHVNTVKVVTSCYWLIYEEMHSEGLIKEQSGKGLQFLIASQGSKDMNSNWKEGI